MVWNCKRRSAKERIQDTEANIFNWMEDLDIDLRKTDMSVPIELSLSGVLGSPIRQKRCSFWRVVETELIEILVFQEAIDLDAMQKRRRYDRSSGPIECH